MAGPKPSCWRPLVSLGSWAGSASSTRKPPSWPPPATRATRFPRKTRRQDKWKTCKLREEVLESRRINCWNFCPHFAVSFQFCHAATNPGGGGGGGRLTRKRKLRLMAPKGLTHACTSTQTGNVRENSSNVTFHTAGVLEGSETWSEPARRLCRAALLLRGGGWKMDFQP